MGVLLHTLRNKPPARIRNNRDCFVNASLICFGHLAASRIYFTSSHARNTSESHNYDAVRWFLLMRKAPSDVCVIVEPTEDRNQLIITALIPRKDADQKSPGLFSTRVRIHGMSTMPPFPQTGRASRLSATQRDRSELFRCAASRHRRSGSRIGATYKRLFRTRTGQDCWLPMALKEEPCFWPWICWDTHTFCGETTGIT
jgi:hypothetical protein